MSVQFYTHKRLYLYLIIYSCIVKNLTLDTCKMHADARLLPCSMCRLASKRRSASCVRSSSSELRTATKFVCADVLSCVALAMTGGGGATTASGASAHGIHTPSALPMDICATAVRGVYARDTPRSARTSGRGSRDKFPAADKSISRSSLAASFSIRQPFECGLHSMPSSVLPPATVALIRCRSS